MGRKLQVAAILVGILFLYFVVTCRNVSDEQLAEIHCGRCHLVPDPTMLPKDTWRDVVLPRMSYFLQSRRVEPDHPLHSLSMEEQVVLNNRGLYPAKDLITKEEWVRLVEFYLDKAPDTLPQRVVPSIPNQVLFEEYLISDGDGKPPMNSLVRIENNRLWVGDGYGSLTSYSWNGVLVERQLHTDFSMPVDLLVRPSQMDVLDMGLIMPNDRRLGKLIRLIEGTRETLFDGLRRPVSMTELEDGRTAIGEFGHMTGALSIRPGTNNSTDLVGQPGCVKVLLQDMDKDGQKELVALFGQGDEGVVICSPCDAEWCCKKVISLHPLFGSSDMELADIDADGWTDIVLAGGDNADYSIVDKDYHGVYFYRNKGSFTFEAYDFLPMHGCTNIEVSDFDGDGDRDVMASAFFPVLDQEGLSRSVIYFENTGIRFEAKKVNEAKEGRWLVMDGGDVDDDGDTDIILGSFSLHPSPVGADLKSFWQNNGARLLILENKIIP